jgi:hypothetical protein
MASCGGETRKDGRMNAPVTAIPGKMNPTVLPARVDSFDILYYKKPFTDSLRYARFFKVVHSRDTTLLIEMNKVFGGSYTRLSEIKKCLSEGKIIFPLEGDAYRTIYFSRTESGCSYLYYIKDGAFYYYDISPAIIGRLNELEKKAVEPQ